MSSPSRDDAEERRHMTCEQPTDTPDDVDIPALREKYRQEREKRLRTEGSKQYVELEGAFAGYYETDPYSPPLVRSPIVEDIDVAVIGGGFAGLLCGAELKKAGVEDVRIIELGGDFGGVWYWNRYPGIQCDNESYCYIPLLEELDFMPSKKFADGAEIYEHCRRIGKHFGLYDSAIFSTQVRDLRWDDAIKRWRISTDRADDIRARFVVMASGPFHRPKLPGIPGLKDFKGHSFHTSRWDYDYTGGDSTGGLDKLSDKRVALVGTGATGIQVTPYIARHAKHLYIFQRTPSSVDVRNNTPTDPEWVKSLQPGWQKERQRNFHSWTFEGMALGQPDLVCDFWTELGRNTAARVLALDDPASLSPEEFMAIREEEDYKVMERLRRRVEGVVDDKDTAEVLKPYYRFLCKRPLSNDEYLTMFNRPNVSLIDVSATKGVQRATEKGLVANDVEYEVDCVIYASGFEITTELSRRYSIDAIEGRGELALFDYWADGYQTLHGMTTRGFPNQFFTGFTQVGISANIAANYELQGEHIAYIIAETMARGATTVEPSQHAQDDWGKAIRDNAIDNSGFDAQCTPGYYNNEGGGGGEGIRSHLGEPYAPGFYAFGDLLAGWRAKGDLDGLVLGMNE
jgi:cyclohexanone monooxygenase